MLNRIWTKLENFWFAGNSAQTLRVLLPFWAALNLIDIALIWLPFLNFDPSQPWGVFRLLYGLRPERWWNLFTYFDGPVALFGSLFILVIALIWLIIGRRFLRPTLALALYLVCCFHHSGGQIAISYYGLLRFSGFCLLFAPAIWALRLIQLRFSLLYLGTALYKLMGPAWLSGEAFLFALQMPSVALPYVSATLDPLDLPFWFLKIFTWTVIAVESYVGVALWSSRLRRSALVLAFVFHFGMFCFLSVQLFQLIMFFGLAAFVDWSSVRIFFYRRSKA